MQPLFKWGIFTGVLNDLLCDHTSEESSHWGDASSGVGYGLCENIIFHVHFMTIVPIGVHLSLSQFFAFSNICLCWVSDVLGDELLDTVESNVELLGSTEFSKIWRLQHSILSGRRWVFVGLFPGVELHG